MGNADRTTDVNQYPPGWDHDRVAALAAHHDGQSDEKIAAEIESATDDPTTVIAQVRRDLLPDVRN